MTTDQAAATYTYSIYVHASPEAIWDALTNPEQTDRYGYGGRMEYELRPGGSFRAHASAAMREQGMGDVIIDGEVIEVNAPHRLVQTWNPLFGPPVSDEPTTRLTWEITESAGASKLTVTHELGGAPVTAGLVSGVDEMGGGGWAFMLSDLKTLLETGTSFAGS